jgi:hypothetical protein
LRLGHLVGGNEGYLPVVLLGQGEEPTPYSAGRIKKSGCVSQGRVLVLHHAPDHVTRGHSGTTGCLAAQHVDFVRRYDTLFLCQIEHGIQFGIPG